MLQPDSRAVGRGGTRDRDRFGGSDGRGAAAGFPTRRRHRRPRARVPAAADSEYVKWDPATKTVTFRLVAGPFDFNGFTAAAAR